MRRSEGAFAILLVLLVAVAGCALPSIPAGKSGYGSDKYPVGSNMSARMQLVDKGTCTFGSMPFLVRVSEPGFCDNLVEKNYYKISGQVVGYQEDHYSVGNLSSSYIASAMAGASEVVVTVPVVNAGRSISNDFGSTLFDNIAWTQNMTNRTVQFICSSARRTTQVKVTYGYGTEGYALFSLPARADSSFEANLSSLTYGTYDMVYPDGAERTFYNLLVKVEGLPPFARLSDLDNLIALNKTYYLCPAYDKLGTRGYYACEAQPLSFSDISRLSLTLMNGNQTCNANIQMAR